MTFSVSVRIGGSVHRRNVPVHIGHTAQSRRHESQIENHIRQRSESSDMEGLRDQIQRAASRRVLRFYGRKRQHR